MRTFLAGPWIQEPRRHDRRLRLVHRRSTEEATRHGVKGRCDRLWTTICIASGIDPRTTTTCRAARSAVHQTHAARSPQHAERTLSGRHPRPLRTRALENVDAEQAYTDPIFNEKPDILPAGESLVRALAIQTGSRKNRANPPKTAMRAPNIDRLGLSCHRISRWQVPTRIALHR